MTNTRCAARVQRARNGKLNLPPPSAAEATPSQRVGVCYLGALPGRRQTVRCNNALLPWLIRKN